MKIASATLALLLALVASEYASAQVIRVVTVAQPTSFGSTTQADPFYGNWRSMNGAVSMRLGPRGFIFTNATNHLQRAGSWRWSGQGTQFCLTLRSHRGDVNAWTGRWIVYGQTLQIVHPNGRTITLRRN